MKNSDALYTDVWVSISEPESVWEENINALLPYRVTKKLMFITSDNAVFIHRLTAFYNLKTGIGKTISNKFGMNCLKVENAVF